MKKPRFLYIFLVLIFLLPASIGAIDIGLVVNEYFGYSNPRGFEFRAGIVPRASILIGENSNIFFSAEFEVGKKDGAYYHSERMNFLRTEFSTVMGPWGFRIGRFNYSDPLTFAAEGLFDGVQLTHTNFLGRTSIGAWYSDTYNLLAAIEWEHPSVMDLFQFKASYTGNIDVSFASSTDKFHSHFFTFKAGLPISSFLIEVGGVHEVTRTEEAGVPDTYAQALAFELGFYWTLPTSFPSRLSFIGRTALGPFVPVRPKHYGEIFTASLSGITIITLDYTARVFRQLGAGVTASYYIRNDIDVPNSFPIAGGNNGQMLGGEVSTKIVWNPFSDLQFILGAGAFFPAMGNNWPNIDPLWRIDLTLILAVL